jgi:hypothetical protein
LRKEIVAFAVLTCLLLMSIQTVLATSTTSIYGPFIAPGPIIGNEPLSPFDATFIHMTEASVTLSLGTYTFEMHMLSTPTDWMAWTSSSPPTWMSPHTHTKLTLVGYGWFISDASGHFLGGLHYRWLAGGTFELEVVICPASANLGCIVSMGSGKGLGYQIYYPSSLTPILNQAGNSVSLTISESQFSSLFPTATQWRALAAGCQMASASANSCTGYITTTRISLPT